jgi:CBS domain containing-hemolysin-like protein
MILINLVIIAGCIALNAFFVAVEYAVVASRRSRLETIADGESKSLELVRSWLDQPNKRDRLIAANQVAITLINLAVGALKILFHLFLRRYFQRLNWFHLSPSWNQYLRLYPSSSV